LDSAGRVSFKKDGLWLNYSIADGNQSPYADVLIGNIKHWLEDYSEVAELIEKLPLIDRGELSKKW
jgi:ArsR family transcriptional regulator